MSRKVKSEDLVQVTFECEDGSTHMMWARSFESAQHALVATKLEDTTVTYVLMYAESREALDRKIKRFAKRLERSKAAYGVLETQYAVAK